MMLDSSAMAASLNQSAPGHPAPGQLLALLGKFLPRSATPAQTVAAVEAVLQSPIGESLRQTMARWIVDEMVPVDELVPEAYVQWRPPVRDAMMFVVVRLSPARLAPKLVEQIELPPNTSAEERLLRLIARVPGLQKLGQVIARNRHLHPALRKALTKLENGIRDVRPEDICTIIRRDLGNKLQIHDVRIADNILSEASVSAVVRFTWRNPETGRRQRGVFKVLKPHIPEYFAEDMEYLQGLAQYFGDRHHRYGFPAGLIPDTFRKVRRLLRYEVNFTREQKTLAEAGMLYQGVPGVRVPDLIKALCAPAITALTEERGTKVTNAAARLPAERRRQLAGQLMEALVAVPLFAASPKAIFHGDPHAGNLLYDNRRGVLVILDWALRERLSREQRRHLALLFLMMSLRDPVGTAAEIGALTRQRFRTSSPRGRMIRQSAAEFLGRIPPSSLPGVPDAMRLLEEVALKGVRFPASLVMVSKVMFTLDGVLGDIVGRDPGLGFAVARRVARRWLINRAAFRSPLRTQDWLTLQCSALLYTSRLWVQWEQAMLTRLLARRSQAPPAIA